MKRKGCKKKVNVVSNVTDGEIVRNLTTKKNKRALSKELEKEYSALVCNKRVLSKEDSELLKVLNLSELALLERKSERFNIISAEGKVEVFDKFRPLAYFKEYDERKNPLVESFNKKRSAERQKVRKNKQMELLAIKYGANKERKSKT